MQMNRKPWFVLGCVLCLSLTTVSASIIDDDFTGSAGSAVNSSIWTTANSTPAGSVTQDGAGNVVFNATVGYTVMETLPAYHAAPGVGEYGKITMDNYVTGVHTIMGLVNQTWSDYILIRTDRDTGPWSITFKIASGAEQNYNLGLAAVDVGNPHDWAIQWDTSAVRVFYDGGLLFDSTTGAPGANIPTVALGPWFHAMQGTDSMDRTTWGIVPEPTTMCILAAGGCLAVIRRKRV